MSRGRQLALAALAGAGACTYALVVRGAVTVDLSLGRSTRPLGPLAWEIAAPREVVFEVIAEPYLRRAPRALAAKLRVLERSEQMVLAEHYTPVGLLTTTTLETVRLEPPELVHFRLVRGPVPYALEQFYLTEADEGTHLEYSGELGTDLWAAGRLWGAVVASKWEAAVQSALDGVAAEAERRAAHR